MHSDKLSTAHCLAATIIFLGIIGEMSSPASAHSACPIEMYKRAEFLLTGARGSWPSLLKHQRTFASCDDGALAEDYSDAVVTLFANEWDQFDVFVRTSKRYPAFRRWAVRHIDATTSDKDLKKIMLNAARCTGDVKKKNLCKTIRQAAVNGLRE